MRTAIFLTSRFQLVSILDLDGRYFEGTAVAVATVPLCCHLGKIRRMFRDQDRHFTHWLVGRSVLSRALCKTLYEGCIRSYQWIHPFINGHQDDDFDFRPEIVIENIQKVSNSPKIQREGSLMVLNNGLHYPISLNFTTHQELIRNLIHSLKKNQEKNLNNSAKIIWKTNTSIRQEICEKNTTSWRFFTAQVWKATQLRNPYYRDDSRVEAHYWITAYTRKWIRKKHLALEHSE